MRLQHFDIVNYLDSEESITHYLNAVLEENNAELLLTAIGDIARARGIAKVTEETGLSRERLYKTLRPGAKPPYETVMKILNALQVKLHAVPA